METTLDTTLSTRMTIIKKKRKIPNIDMGVENSNTCAPMMGI